MLPELCPGEVGTLAPDSAAAVVQVGGPVHDARSLRRYRPDYLPPPFTVNGVVVRPSKVLTAVMELDHVSVGFSNGESYRKQARPKVVTTRLA